MIDKAVKQYQQILNQSDSVFPTENMKAAFALAKIYGTKHYNPDRAYNHLIIPYYDKAIDWARYSGDSLIVSKLIQLRQQAQNDINNDNK